MTGQSVKKDVRVNGSSAISLFNSMDCILMISPEAAFFTPNTYPHALHELPRLYKQYQQHFSCWCSE